MNSNNERKEEVCLKQIGSSIVAKLAEGAWDKQVELHEIGKASSFSSMWEAKDFNTFTQGNDVMGSMLKNTGI